MASTSTNRPKSIWLNPKRITVPDVRITSTWDPEMLEMFKSSITADGIQQPIVCVKDGETWWLVDGRHRLEEALVQGLTRVQVVYQEGTLRQVMTRNLYLNRLRGSVKVSEMIRVVKWLGEKESLSIDSIHKETGLRTDYVEHLLECGQALPEVLDELDREGIGVGHAHELARVRDRDVQLRLLAQTLQYRIKVADLKNVVDETLKILEARAQTPSPRPAPDPYAIPTIPCHACGQDYPIKRVVGVNLCVGCWGLLDQAVRDARKDGRLPSPPAPPPPP